MRAQIMGLGQWMPDTVRTNAEYALAQRADRGAGSELLAVDVGQHDPYERIVERRSRAELTDPFQGSVQRRVADEALPSSEAEARAGRAALADAGITAEALDLVLSWSIVPDRVSPPNAPRVAHLLGARGAAALGVEAACASAIAQLELAAAMIETGRARYVLLTQSHLIHRACPITHPVSPHMGDAASAIVVGPSERPGVLATRVASDGAFYNAVTWCRDRATDPPWWTAGPASVPGSLDREATNALTRGALRVAVDTVSEAKARVGRPVAIDVLACTQPRAWFPGALAEALGMPDASAPCTFTEYAHLGGCGVVVNLLEARQRGLLRPGVTVAMYTMGAGITRAAALLAWRPDEVPRAE